MVYKFTKSDEGKYFYGSCWCADNYLQFYYYIVKVIGQVVICRFRFYTRGMERVSSLWNQKHWTKWKTYIIEINNKSNEIPENIAPGYPLNLVILGHFKKPSERLTKKELQMVEEV